jgi:two-component system response regulator HupR/HoxA
MRPHPTQTDEVLASIAITIHNYYQISTVKLFDRTADTLGSDQVLVTEQEERSPMADIEVRWEDFDKMLVIKRLRTLVGAWFRVQLNFTDHKGFLRGVPEGKFFNPLTKVSQAISANERGFADCMAHARKTTVDSMSAKKPQLSRGTSGFSSLSVPIRIDSQFLGCVYGDGFIIDETKAEQLQHIKTYLQRVLPNRAEDLIATLDTVPILGNQEVTYLTELINLVVAEILLIHKSLHASRKKIDELSEELGSRYGFDNMVGKSAPMQNLYRMIERVSKSDSTVLIQGENGTGKELIARALHYNSPRRSGKFVVINCGAFNDNLLESELFGHMKGSFTGAIKDKKGLFEEADGGTLFLDEIGETSLSMQVKMLRVLQDSTFTPVGSTKLRKTDARVLAATNRNLSAMVKDGTFREDLYYRLNVINLGVPPLRDRKEDVKMLLQFFLERHAKASQTALKEVDKDCMRILLNHDWPGNVRELENEVERLCVLAGNDQALTSDLLSPRIKQSGEGSSSQKFANFQTTGKLKDAIEAMERAMILEGLQRTHWNKSQLAKDLGISRAGLIMKVEKYGLEKRTA